MAARRKFIIARIGDITFLIAITLIYFQFGTGDLSGIFDKLDGLDPSNLPTSIHYASIALIITALLKSAQFPFHSWLIEVMEAPTPVSALLHAGLLNAGPFLMLRFSKILYIAPIASTLLIIVGALTAIFGSLVFTKQSAIKTSLAYSSVAHMGFTLMLSGLGLYSASLLHLVAHSFYKAHAFLSSGSVVEKVRIQYGNNLQRKHNPFRALIGISLAVGVFLLADSIWSSISGSPSIQNSFIGIIMLFGLLIIVTNAIDSNISKLSLLQLLGTSLVFLFTFLTLEFVMTKMAGVVLPESNHTISFLAAAIAVVFLTVIGKQILSKNKRSSNLSKKLDVHLKNGLYINHLFDRLVVEINNKLLFKLKK